MSTSQRDLFDQLTPRAAQLISVTQTAKPLRFNGPAYDPKADNERLTTQFFRIFNLMKDGRWRRVSEIAEITRDPEQSVGSQLRHFRKKRFGAHRLDRRNRGGGRGPSEYRLTVNFGDPRSPSSAWLVPPRIKMDILLLWKRALELGVKETELRELLGGYGCTSRKELTPEQARDFTSELSRMIRARSNHA